MMLNMDYAQRRERLARQLPGKSVAILMNPKPAHKTGDQDYAYRPDSNMLYFCGMDEPGAVAVIMSADQAKRMVMFVLPRDPERERWVGPRYGCEGAVAQFKADEAFDIGLLKDKLSEILFALDGVYFDFSQASELSPMLFEVVEKLRHRGRHAAEGPRAFCDLRDIVGEMRRIKDADEIEAMKRAAAVSVAGFKDVCKMLRPGIGEWEVEATLQHGFRARGAIGESFGSICAGGAHATTLHYEANRDRLNDGDLILIDAGAEVDYYAGDISRTYPVNGRFTDAQRDIYALVLKAQKEAIKMCVVGNHMKSPHERVREVFADGLHALGIFAEEPKEILEKNLDFEFFFHGTSHYLGMDTHDVGIAYGRGDDAPAPLLPGVVITVEPGLYFTENDARVPEKYRGIGIRIEDDVLITEDGPVVLTADLPKEIEDIEK
ncbi:MAG: aminopeptidase P N-terminal domain-containing protein [Proteobacteria bacterium]|nr:aminopeptidase P N-terminal domain-containing protein [Pseudomonadota bacterium]